MSCGTHSNLRILYVATAGQVLGAAFEYFGGAEVTIAESSANFESAAIYGPAGADNSICLETDV